MALENVCTNRLLKIDLGDARVQEERIDPDTVRDWLLGSGLAARIFYEAIDPARDPLDPASPLLVLTGLLTGTCAPAASRSTWCARSPLTGIWGESNVGGYWGAHLRFAGFDGLVVTGRADAPVYLWIHDGEAEIRDASHLWGQDTFAAHDQLRKETNRNAHVACIGPAGENGVRLAGVMTGGQAHNRTAGRCGMGALMGAKNLKAIVVHGRERPSYADDARFRAVVRRLNRYVRARSEGLYLAGTAGGVPATERFGDLPLKNWQEGSWPVGAQAISGQAMRQTIWTHNTHCFACPIQCGQAIEITDGPYAGTRGEGPEYETLAGFGGNLLIDDLHAVSAMNQLCNRLGLDTISISSAIAFATEALERGLLLPREAGLPLQWGAPGPALQLIEQIARREGLGDLLADGVRAAAARLGPEAESFAVHAKGLEVAYHDPRAFVDMALNYATAARGGCHLESLSYWHAYGVNWPGWHDERGDRFASDETSVRLVIDLQDFLATYNPLGLCKFIVKGGMDPERTAELVSAAMGWEWTAADLMRAGERIFNLKRLINLRLGVTAADDVLPQRLLAEPRPSGTAAGNLPDLAGMLPRYYELRGWDAQGRPGADKLRELGIT
ncbi:MAG: aldehyde ferredoxin oxidoreductase family protein [Anaerolineae bacterium]|nr:aldehyde ferredoxin oxidoreductase family protein [Anaerolineae bacterium]